MTIDRFLELTKNVKLLKLRTAQGTIDQDCYEFTLDKNEITLHAHNTWGDKHVVPLSGVTAIKPKGSKRWIS